MKVTSDIDDIPAAADALVLLSGGFDSVACALALQDNGNSVCGLTFDYKGRPTHEVERCSALAAHLGVSLTTVPLPDTADARTLAPELHSTRHEAWFPYRNLLFLSHAFHFAFIGDFEIVSAGTRVWDTDAYNDATPAFMQSMAGLADLTGNPERPTPTRYLYLPHIEGHDFASKMYARHTETLDRTWSCWRDRAEPCGVCAPCLTRQRFIEEAHQSVSAEGL